MGGETFSRLQGRLLQETLAFFGKTSADLGHTPSAAVEGIVGIDQTYLMNFCLCWHLVTYQFFCKVRKNCSLAFAAACLAISARSICPIYCSAFQRSSKALFKAGRACTGCRAESISMAKSIGRRCITSVNKMRLDLPKCSKRYVVIFTILLLL